MKAVRFECLWTVHSMWIAIASVGILPFGGCCTVHHRSRHLQTCVWSISSEFLKCLEMRLRMVSLKWAKKLLRCSYKTLAMNSNRWDKSSLKNRWEQEQEFDCLPSSFKRWMISSGRLRWRQTDDPVRIRLVTDQWSVSRESCVR